MAIDDAPILVKRYALSGYSIRFPSRLGAEEQGIDQREISAAKTWLRANGWVYEVRSCTWWHGAAAAVVKIRHPGAIFRRRRA